MVLFPLNKRCEIFDPIRQRWVIATPEEMVRQRCLSYLIQRCQFPKESISIEKRLSSFPHVRQRKIPVRRLDILCYGPRLAFPLLLIECKAIPIQEKMLAQVWGYNTYIKAPFVALIDKQKLRMEWEENGERKYCSFIPTYQELCKAYRK